MCIICILFFLVILAQVWRLQHLALLAFKMLARFSGEGCAAMERALADQSCVYLLVVKGNLRHRIVKLGCELEWDRQSPAQRELSRVMVNQKFGHSNNCAKLQYLPDICVG